MKGPSWPAWTQNGLRRKRKLPQRRVSLRGGAVTEEGLTAGAGAHVRGRRWGQGFQARGRAEALAAAGSGRRGTQARDCRGWWEET